MTLTRFTAQSPLIIRRTKIVATVGPASSSPEVLSQLIEAGVNTFRLNFSHGSHASHAELFATIRTVAAKLGRHVAILADLCGPKIRAGHFEGGGIDLEDGARVVVTVRKVKGRAGLIPSEYEALASDVSEGDRILLDDGRRELEVVSIDGTEIECVVIQGGRLTDRKGINLPGVEISAPSLTDKDRSDAHFAVDLGVDFMALSFVRHADDVRELRALLEGFGREVPIISKIEKPEALDHIDEILEVSAGIMVARGDLGVEIPAEEVPLIQRELTALAIEQNRLVIVATQMLESMIDNPRPTRAEVTDVAWAAMAGADAVMLSGETAAGSFPVAAVETMDRVLRLVESNQFHGTKFQRLAHHTHSAAEAPTVGLQLGEALARGAGLLSRELSARAIVVRSYTGATAQMVSTERPAAPIVAVTESDETARRLSLYWAVAAYVRPIEQLSGDPLAYAPQLVKDLGLAKPGDFLLLASGGSNQQERNAPSLRILSA